MLTRDYAHRRSSKGDTYPVACDLCNAHAKFSWRTPRRQESLCRGRYARFRPQRRHGEGRVEARNRGGNDRHLHREAKSSEAGIVRMCECTAYRARFGRVTGQQHVDSLVLGLELANAVLKGPRPGTTRHGGSHRTGRICHRRHGAGGSLRARGNRWYRCTDTIGASRCGHKVGKEARDHPRRNHGASQCRHIAVQTQGWQRDKKPEKRHEQPETQNEQSCGRKGTNARTSGSPT